MTEHEKVMLICQACYGRMNWLKYMVLRASLTPGVATLQDKMYEDELKNLEEWWAEKLDQTQRDKIVRVNGELATGFKSLLRGYKTDGH